MARWRRSPEKERDELWEFSLLATIGVVLVLLVAFLMLLEISVKDPEYRWILFLLLLVIAGLILIYMVFPRQARGLEYAYQEPEVSGSVGKVDTEATNYARALEGNPYSQMMVLKELREVALRRIMLNRHFSRVEAKALASSAKDLKQVVQDPDIIWLLASDFDYEYGVDNLSSRMGREMVANFTNIYLSLLRKVEDLR